jgi:hypothetical protein
VIEIPSFRTYSPALRGNACSLMRVPVRAVDTIHSFVSLNLLSIDGQDNISPALLRPAGHSACCGQSTQTAQEFLFSRQVEPLDIRVRSRNGRLSR